jgi:thiopeptide-type bacteriocin biosynthesis protein
MMFSRSAGRLVMESAGGASATALLGRFSLFSRGVHDHCRKIAEAESRANPDVIFAELHQVSHLRVDDISRRRPIYDQVIPVNTYPSLPGLRHILPADLLLSVSGDTLILESASLGKRVIPRLPTAYNYSHSDMALFRLLCDLQYQGLQAGLNFDPEQLFPGLDFYPRIEYRDVVLAPAKWKLTKVALAPLLAGPPSISRLHLFRQEKGLPRHIASGTGDQQLVFDLGRDEEALFFLEQLRGQDGATLREYFFPDTYVKSNRCPLTGQFIVVWLQESRVYTGLPEVHTVASIKTPRSFLPGSEWLYVKLYCAPESATAVLLQVVLPFLQRNADSIRCWFFIRYQDPGPHLRFRVRTAEGEAVSLMSALGRLVSMGEHRELVREHRADTYHRELERYSPELMEDVELFFRAGSDWVLRYLVKKNAPGQEVFAELAPFVLVYRWCRVFVPEITDLVAFLDRLKKHYLKEFGGDRQLLVGLDRKYRGLSGAFRAVLENTPATGPDDHWTDMCIGDIAALNLRAAAWPAPKREKLLADLVHMQVNRIYASGQRRYEGVIYYCLHKYAASVLARQV